MEKERIETATGPVPETEHCENTAQIITGTTPESPGGYNASRFNALRHGVLSAHTVLVWESKEQYEALLNALVEEHEPHGATEEHFVEEIAGVIWRKRRLRIGEAASCRHGIIKGFGGLEEACDRVEFMPQLAVLLGYLDPRDLDSARENVRGEVFPCEKLEQLSRYEVHLDRKLERMLAMLLRLQSLRRSNESG